MNKIKIIVGVALLAAATATAQITMPLGDLIQDSRGGGTAASEIKSAPLTIDYYGPHEFSVDLFGQYDANTDASLFQTPLKGGDWAFGIGGNYFVTENFGAGVDLYCLEPGANREAQPGTGGKQLIKQLNVSLLARYPMGRWAPYFTGGGGYNIHEAEFTTHAGLGCEVRIHNGLGVFGEARHIWIMDGSAPDEVQFRMGFRVSSWPETLKALGLKK